MKELQKNHYGSKLLQSFSTLAIAMTLLLTYSCDLIGKKGEGGSISGDGFSADMIMTLPNGMKMMESKIYVTPEASRMDWKQGKANLSSIRKERENKEYLFNHDKKLYYEIDLNEDKELSSFVKSVSDYEVIEELGKEKINGFNCIKKRVKTSAEIMGMDISTEMIIWQAEGIAIPIRTQGEEGNVTELKNISTKTPSSKLFELPSGYQKAKSIMDVMGFGFDMDDYDVGDYDFGQAGEGTEVTAAELREMIEQYKKSNDPDAQWMVEHLTQMLSIREAIEAEGGQQPDWDFDRDGDMDPDRIYNFVQKYYESTTDDPEKIEEMRQILSGAREIVKDTHFGEGTADDIWKNIPKRPGDSVTNEFRVQGTYGVEMKTNATMNDIVKYYEDKLKSEGWKVAINAVFDGEGMVMFERKDHTLTISSVELDQRRKLKNYSMQLTKKNF